MYLIAQSKDGVHWSLYQPEPMNKEELDAAERFLLIDSDVYCYRVITI